MTLLTQLSPSRQYWRGQVVDGPVYLDACVLIALFCADDKFFDPSVRFVVTQLEAGRPLLASLLAVSEALRRLADKTYGLNKKKKNRTRRELEGVASECRKAVEYIEAILTIIGADGLQFRGTLDQIVASIPLVKGQVMDGWHCALAMDATARTVVTTDSDYDAVSDQVSFRVVILQSEE